MFPEIYQWLRRLFRLKCYETILTDRVIWLFAPILFIYSVVVFVCKCVAIIIIATVAVNHIPFDEVKFGIFNWFGQYLKFVTWFGIVAILATVGSTPTVTVKK